MLAGSCYAARSLISTSYYTLRLYLKHITPAIYILLTGETFSQLAAVIVQS